MLSQLSYYLDLTSPLKTTFNFLLFVLVLFSVADLLLSAQLFANFEFEEVNPLINLVAGYTGGIVSGMVIAKLAFAITPITLIYFKSRNMTRIPLIWFHLLYFVTVVYFIVIVYSLLSFLVLSIYK